MKKILFSKARFLAASFEPSQFPSPVDCRGDPLPEIALVGRSNVGKSSLINHLLNSPSLAKTSSTPGKTQSINFFSVDDQLTLVDLPGYGYAQVPKQIKNKWGSLIDTYFQTRSCLSCILLLIDSRREPSPEDVAFLKWASFHHKPLLVLLTKSDKLSSQEKKCIPPIFHPFCTLHYSIKEPSARMALIKTLNTFLDTHGNA